MTRFRWASLIFSCCIGTASAGCASGGGRTTYFAPDTLGRCDGEEFVEVANQSGRTVDIYAIVSREVLAPNAGTLIGAASPGTTRLSLVSTVAEGRSAGFSGRLNGAYVQQVTFRRGCEHR